MLQATPSKNLSNICLNLRHLPSTISRLLPNTLVDCIQVTEMTKKYMALVLLLKFVTVNPESGYGKG
jgi:hypothetical protein